MNFKDYLIESLKDIISDNEYKTITDNAVNDISDKLRDLRRTDRVNTLLKPSGVGSSREYYRIKSPDSINLDGQKTPIETGIKVAYNGKFGSEMGIKQNQNEDRDLSKHSIIQKDEYGNYHTNESGIILPSLEHDKDHKWIHTLHVEPLSGKNKLEDYTKTPEHPNGISANDIEETFVLGKHKKDSHPLIQQIKKFADDNNIAYADIHSENMGIFTHPITKKKYPVILDHGVTNGLLSSD